MARKLTTLILDAQGTGELKMATTMSGAPTVASDPGKTLTANLVHFLSTCGVMRAAVQAGFKDAAK